MIDLVPPLVNFIAWICCAVGDWGRYRASRIGLAWLIVDVLVILLCAALTWKTYARHQTELRERTFRALAGPLPEGRSEVLRLGSRGPSVLQWKARLRELGYVVSGDDVFDADTAAATAAYQAQLGLVADGIAGPVTIRLGRLWRRIRR